VRDRSQGGTLPVVAAAPSQAMMPMQQTALWLAHLFEQQSAPVLHGDPIGSFEQPVLEDATDVVVAVVAVVAEVVAGAVVVLVVATVCVAETVVLVPVTVMPLVAELPFAVVEPLCPLHMTGHVLPLACIVAAPPLPVAAAPPID